MADGEIKPIIYPASCWLCSTPQVLNQLKGRLMQTKISLSLIMVHMLQGRQLLHIYLPLHSIYSNVALLPCNLFSLSSCRRVTLRHYNSVNATYPNATIVICKTKSLPIPRPNTSMLAGGHLQ